MTTHGLFRTMGGQVPTVWVRKKWVRNLMTNLMSLLQYVFDLLVLVPDYALVAV